jgi:hypothetical protein
MRRYVFLIVWLFLLAPAADVLRLDYDQGVLLPSSARKVELTSCPVPSGFWTPLEEKGWVTECFIASGDPKVLRLALQVSLKKAGYRLESSEEQTLAGTTLFYIETWNGNNKQLFIETFLFTDQNNAVYLIAHPPH